VKNCDWGLENAARGRRVRAAFSSPRSHFFTLRTNLSRQITCCFLSCRKLVLQITYRLVYATLSLNLLVSRLLTICKKSSQWASNSASRQSNFWNYFMLVAFILPVKFSKICFCSVKFRVKFEVLLQKQFLSVIAIKIMWNQTFLL